MDSKEDITMKRNVGTNGWPVTFLHERAVALLYDELTRPDIKTPEVRVRLIPGGDWSHDLRAGVESVKVPDGEWDQVGGIVPDLVLYGEDARKPVRIIEVVVSNPPDKAKQKKLDTLGRRGVDVVVVQVEKSKDLDNLCRMKRKPIFRSRMARVGDYPSHASGIFWRQEHMAKDRMVEDLIEAIIHCSPTVRRDLRDVLDQIGTLDSLYPIRPGNPLKDKLGADNAR